MTSLLPDLRRSHRFPFGPFTLLMALDVGVQLVEKLASLRAVGASSGGAESGPASGLLLSYLTQPWVWVVLALKIAQLLTWTQILRRVDISLAFPLTALAYPLTMLFAVLLFHEHLGWQIWTGALLITAGAVVMGKSSQVIEADGPNPA